MSNELISFEFESTSSSIRVVEIDGELWFVAKDVAEALEYVWNGTECVRHVPEKWRGVRSVLTPSGLQEMVVLAEQGLYFFVLRSDKPKAFPFQEWLAGDVLLTLRQRGHYGLPNHSERCKKGLQSATTHRQPGQALTPSPKFIARLFGEEILAFAAQLAQRRAAKKKAVRHELASSCFVRRWLSPDLVVESASRSTADVSLPLQRARWIAYDRRRLHRRRPFYRRWDGGYGRHA